MKTKLHQFLIYEEKNELKTKCIYCEICKKETKYHTKPEFSRYHLKKIHQITWQEYQFNYFNKPLPKHNYECQICHKMINKEKLSLHIHQYHKILSEDYFREFLIKEDQSNGICPLNLNKFIFYGIFKGFSYCKNQNCSNKCSNYKISINNICSNFKKFINPYIPNTKTWFLEFYHQFNDKSGRFIKMIHYSECIDYLNYAQNEMNRFKINDIRELTYLLLNNLVEIPKCPYCNKNRKFNTIQHGYHKSCANKECISKEFSNGRIVSDETRKKQSKSLKGKKRSNKTKQILSKAMKDNPNVKWSEERKQIHRDLMIQYHKDNPNVGKERMNYARNFAYTDEANNKKKETLFKHYGVTNAGRLTKYSSYSKISQILFWQIVKELKLDITQCNFATCNGEKSIFLNSNATKPDFIYKNIIIEFFGDLFHGNPLIFSSYNCPNPYYKKLTAEKIWQHDYKRVQEFINLGYQVYIIWERDFRNNPKSIIKNIIQKF